MTEFRFPPLTLPEPTGVDPVLERAPARASCCGNCDQGLPCASSRGGGSGGRGRHDERVRSTGTPCRGGDHALLSQNLPLKTGGTCAPLPSTPLPPSFLTTEPPIPDDARSSWQSPMDLEVSLIPMLERTSPDHGRIRGKRDDPNWDFTIHEQGAQATPVPKSHCAPLPVDLKFDRDRYRCALGPCINQTGQCSPIVAGLYSAQSQTQPVFSYSKWEGGKLVSADCSIIRAIAYHIDMTQAGDEVLIAIAAWWTEGWPILKAIQEANDRAVTVRVITGVKDQSVWFHTSTWIHQALEKAIGPANVKYWTNTKSFPNISHNKFVLIRRGKTQRLVLITGANWASFDIARHCDLLTVNSEPIWSAFHKYWHAMESAPKNAKADDYETEVEDPETGVTAHFWPVLNAYGDPDLDGGMEAKNPFIQILRKYKKENTTKIRVIAAHWGTGGPGGGFLGELEAFRAAGADVRVVGNHHLDPPCHSSGSCKVQPKVGVAVGSCETKNSVWERLQDNKIPWAKCPPHAKVLLISGIRIDDGKPHQAVYTGSMNFSYEFGKPEFDMEGELLKVGAMADAFIGVHDDPVIFSQYEEWWRWLCANTAINRGGGDSGVVCGPIPPFSLPNKGS